MFDRARVSVKLAYWLGPFGGDTHVPRGLKERTLELPANADDARAIEVLTFEPQGPVVGQLIAVHGLHPSGPRDPRMQNFCRRLAGAGLRVWAPALTDYMGLRLDEGVIFALRRVAKEIQGHFAVFSISFGSLPAMRLMASEPERMKGLVIFGGYADFATTMRFALGSADNQRDPLNPPAIFINLAKQVEEAPDDVEPVIAAWHTFAVRTWGQPLMRERARFVAVADDLARTLAPDQKELFYLGCGLREGMLEKAEAALQRVILKYAHLDARPYVRDTRIPVTIVHGADDDVIPWQEADALVAALPGSRRFITGLYGHTGAKKPNLLHLAREAWKLFSMIRALAGYVTT